METSTTDLTDKLSPEHRAYLASLPGKYSLFSGWKMEGDGGGDGDGEKPKEETPKDDTDKSGGGDSDKKFTQADLDRLIAQRVQKKDQEIQTLTQQLSEKAAEAATLKTVKEEFETKYTGLESKSKEEAARLVKLEAFAEAFNEPDDLQILDHVRGDTKDEILSSITFLSEKFKTKAGDKNFWERSDKDYTKPTEASDLTAEAMKIMKANSRTT